MKKSNIIDRIKNSYILMFLIFSIVLITSSVIFRNIKYDNISSDLKILEQALRQVDENIKNESSF